MSAEVDPKVVKTTQELLSRVVKKPVITDKLLKRPPFRFIHDLIASIIKTHGFLKDLYKDNELIADNVKEKDMKIAFLQKAIDATGFIIGDVLTAKPSKIVAGLETDKTNQWLQTMARAVIDKKDSTDAVLRVLNGEKPSKRNDKVVGNNNKKKTLNQNTKTSNNLNTKTTKESKESKETKTDVKNNIKESKEESIEAKEAKERSTSPVLSTNNTKKSSAKQSKQDLLTNGLNGNTSKPPSARSLISDNKDNDSNDEIVHKDRDESSDRPNGMADNEHTVTQTQALEPQKMVRPRTAAKSALPSKQIQLQNTETRSPVRPPTRHERIPRPSSSRPAPPRVIPKTSEDNKAIEAELEEKMRLINAKPVENLITENNTNEETDQDFIVSDVLKAEDLESSERLELDAINDTQKGSLVKQLVDTKKELEGTRQAMDASIGDKKVIKQTNRDIEKLRQTIQGLTQTANPLGKVLDYLQEDIDSMLSELKSWQEEYKRNIKTLEKSKNTTGAELEPFRDELNVLDSDIREQIDKISQTKANIIRNEEKLQKMVLMINRV